MFLLSGTAGDVHSSCAGQWDGGHLLSPQQQALMESNAGPALGSPCCSSVHNTAATLDVALKLVHVTQQLLTLIPLHCTKALPTHLLHAEHSEAYAQHVFTGAKISHIASCCSCPSASQVCAKAEVKALL